MPHCRDHGAQWTLVSTPDPDGTGTGANNQLLAANCTTASSCWAAGDAQKNGGADLNQALYWNGTKWSTK
jgi:hypothetical protein